MKFNNNNTLYGIFNTLIKCCALLLVMGFIFTLISGTLGYMIYTKDSFILEFTSFKEIYKLSLTYGLIGILISIIINILSYIIYHIFVHNLKVVMTNIASFIFIGYTFVLNILIKFMYEGLGTYTFDIKYLNFFKNLIINFGFITYPAIFFILYIILSKRKSERKLTK